MLDPKLITWEYLDMHLIEEAYNYTKKLIMREMCDSATRKIIVDLMKSKLPEDYDVKCDEENNPPEVIESQHIVATVSIKNSPVSKINYAELIF